MKFTTEIPPEEPFGTEPNYIVVNPTNGQIWAPQSSRQIRTEKYGWAARGGYMWAKIEPGMVQALSSPQAQGNDELLAEIKRRGDMLEEHGKRVQEARKAAVQAQDAMDRVWRELV